MAEGLVRRFEVELANTPDSARRRRLHHESARLLETPLDRSVEALAHYEAALQLEPDDLPCLRGARRVAIRTGVIGKALELLSQEIELTPEREDRASLHRYRARLLTDHLGDPAAAREALESAAALVPADPSTLTALVQHALAAEDWSGLDRALGRLVEATGDHAYQATLLTQQARIRERRLDDDAGAVALLQRAVALSPADAIGAIDNLQRLLTRLERWHDLIAALELELAQVTEPAARSAVLHRMANVYLHHVGDRPAAMRTLERATRERPDDPVVLDALIHLHEELEDWSALRTTLERRAATQTDPRERKATWFRLGELAAKKLDRPDEAADWYRKALTLDVRYAPAYHALAQYYEATEQWERLIELVIREAEVAHDQGHRAAAHGRAADIAEQRLEDKTLAIQQHERAVTLVPGHPVSFRALSRLYFETGRFQSLVELYERAAGRAQDPGVRRHYLNLIASLYETELGSPEHAIGVYHRLLKLEPRDLAALKALQRAAERAERYPALVDALEMELELNPDPERAVAIRLHIAEVLSEELGERERAIRYLRHVLADDPRSVPAIQRLTEILRRLGRWGDVVAALESLCDLDPDGAGAVDRLLEMAEICERELGRHEQALALCERAATLAPDSVRVLTRLTRALEREGKWERLIEVQHQLVAVIEDPILRAQAACELGRSIEAHDGATEPALDAYRLALKARQDWLPASTALRRLADERGDHDDVLASLAQEREVYQDPWFWRSTLIGEGQLHRDLRGDRAQAIVTFEKIRAADPTDLSTLVELEALYREAGRWTELAKTYRALAEAHRDEGVQVATLRELARLDATHATGDPTVALRTLLKLARDDTDALTEIESLALSCGSRELLRSIDARLLEECGLTPELVAEHRLRLAEGLEAAGHDGALDAYRAALEADGQSITAAFGLARVAEAEGDDQALVLALGHLAELTPSADEAAGFLTRAARIRVDSLADRAGALAALEGALEHAPDDDAAADLVIALSDEPELIATSCDLLARAARSAQSPVQLVKLWRQVARWRQHPLDDRAAAIAALETAAELVPDDIETLIALADLYLVDTQYERAAFCLERALKLSEGGDAGARRELQLRLADVYRSLERPEDSKTLLLHLVERDAEDTVAQRRLFDLHRAQGELEAAYAVGDRLLEALSQETERAVLLVELAALDADLGRANDGATALLEAVRLVGGAGDVIRTYQALIPDQGSWHELRSALRGYLTRGDLDASARVTVLREIARIERHAIAELADAGRTLTEAIELAPDDIELRMELVASLIAAEMGRDALVAARELVALAPRRDESWRLLSQAFLSVGAENAARMALAPVVTRNAASPDEVRQVREASALSRDLAGVSFDLEMIRRAGGESSPTASAERALMASFDAFAKLYPAACRAHANPTALSRVRVRDSHPLRAVVDPVARVFAIDELELYVGDRRTPVCAVAQHTPALALPEDLADAPPGAQRFVLGRALCTLSRAGQAFEILDDSEIGLLLAAIQRMGGASVDAPAGIDHARLQDASKRLAKALPRRARRPLEEAAARLVRDGMPDIARWRRESRRSAMLVGLLLSHDLVAAWPYLAEDQAILEDALLFWTSDLSFKIRGSAALPGYS